jgi:hypothetical protein
MLRIMESFCSLHFKIFETESHKLTNALEEEGRRHIVKRYMLYDCISQRQMLLKCLWLCHAHNLPVQVLARYGEVGGKAVVVAAARMFQSLPLAYVLHTGMGKVLVLHGGLPRQEDAMLADINSLNRFR